MHCEGCGDPSLCDQGKPTHTRWSGQQSHSWAAATHAGVSAPRCCVWALEAAGLSAAWAAATSSPHAITAGQRGTARRPGGYRSAQLHPAMPCGRESLAVTSGDKAPYGDGEGRRLRIKYMHSHLQNRSLLLFSLVGLSRQNFTTWSHRIKESLWLEKTFWTIKSKCQFSTTTKYPPGFFLGINVVFRLRQKGFPLSSFYLLLKESPSDLKLRQRLFLV